MLRNHRDRLAILAVVLFLGACIPDDDFDHPADNAYRVQSLGVGAGHACAVVEDGTVRCFGAGSGGQLGMGDNRDRRSSEEVPGLQDMVFVAGGGTQTCAISETGQTYCWGLNGFGQLGDGTTENRSSPSQLTDAPTFQTISLGENMSCGLSDEGAVYCWGMAGTLLGASDLTVVEPTAVELWADGVEAISVGGITVCALKTGGTVECLGTNFAAAQGENYSASEPWEVEGLTGVQALAVGLNHACALREQGTVHCWGRHQLGQLGHGEEFSNQPVSSPVAVEGIDDAVSIAAGNAFTCAARQSGAVYCWGEHSQGVLGTAAGTENQPSPVQIEGIDNAVELQAGKFRVCAVLTNDGARCWGFEMDSRPTFARNTSTPVPFAW